MLLGVVNPHEKVGVVAAFVAFCGLAAIWVVRKRSHLLAQRPSEHDGDFEIDWKGVKVAPVSREFVRLGREAEANIVAELVNVSFYEGDGHIWKQGERFRTNSSEMKEVLSGVCPQDAVLVYDDPVSKQLHGCVRVRWDPNANKGGFEMVSVPILYGKRGIGSFLVKEAESFLHNKLGREGIIEMDVISVRDDLRKFYARRGYVEKGIEKLPGVLQGRACDEMKHVTFVRMQKALS